MYKKPGCIAETGGWLGFLTFFCGFFSHLHTWQGTRGRAALAQHMVHLLPPQEHSIPGAKKLRNPWRGQERSGRSVQEDDGVDAAEGDGMEKKNAR